MKHCQAQDNTTASAVRDILNLLKPWKFTKAQRSTKECINVCWNNLTPMSRPTGLENDH